MKNTKQCEYKNNLDLLRIISTFAVILIHVNWDFLEPVYLKPDNSFNWIFVSLVNIVTRFSVPAFVMLSGSLVIKDVNAISVTFYKKAFKKIFAPALVTIVGLLIVRITHSLIVNNDIYINIKGVLTGNFYNLWYIYMLVGLYFLVPWIVCVKKTMCLREYTIVSVIILLWGIISQATSSEQLAYSIGVVFAFLGYFLIGDVIHELLKKWTLKKKYINLLLMFIAFLCICVTYFMRRAGYNYYICQAYVAFFSPTIVVYSICIFALFSNMSVIIDMKWLSRMTFYIYLFHMPVLSGVKRMVSFLNIPVILKEVIITLGVFFISLLIAVLYNRIWKSGIEKKIAK